MNKKKHLTVAELNPHLLCILCGGYYVDATTVIECLHTFCKSCIVRYLETSKFCPTCDVLVHKTEPLLSIRPDKSLQNIVYKLIPRLYQNEMLRRRKFYSETPTIKPFSEEDRGNPRNSTYLLPGDTVSVALKPAAFDETQVENGALHTRYFNCPAGVTLGQIKKLLRAKFELPERHPLIITSSEEEFLDDEFTLIDVAYIKSWSKDSPLILYYKIYFNKKIKLESQYEEKSIKLEENNIKLEEETYSSIDAPCMPHLQREEEHILSLDSESRSIPTLSPIKAVSPDSPSPPSLNPTITSSSSSSDISSLVPFHPTTSKSISSSVPTFKAIIPAPVRPVPDLLNLGSFAIPAINSLAPRNCGYGYGIGLLTDPSANVSNLFPGNLIDSTKLGSGTVLPFGLTLGPSLICTPPNINNVSSSFTEQTNLTGLAIQSLISQTEPTNNLIFSFGSQNTPGVRSIPSQPISSVIMPDSSKRNFVNASSSKSNKKPKLIKPKNLDEKSCVEEREVQLMISESGVMIVNEGEKSTNQLQRLINPVYSEANELLTKIESGSLLSSDPYSEEDSKESDGSDGAEKLAQIKMEISSILNTLSEESEVVVTGKSQISQCLDQPIKVTKSSISTNVIASSVTEHNKPVLESPIKHHEKLSLKIPPCEIVKSIVGDSKKSHTLEKEPNNLNSSSASFEKKRASGPSKRKVEEYHGSNKSFQRSPTCTSNTLPNNESQSSPFENNLKKKSGKKSSQPVGYKTLKISPKGWNPTIPREKLQKKLSLSTPKTSKFFKTRNSSIATPVTSEKLPSDLSGVLSDSVPKIMEGTLPNNKSEFSSKISNTKNKISDGVIKQSENRNDFMKQLSSVPLKVDSSKIHETCTSTDKILNKSNVISNLENKVIKNKQNNSLKKDNKICKYPSQSKNEIDNIENCDTKKNKYDKTSATDISTRVTQLASKDKPFQSKSYNLPCLVEDGSHITIKHNTKADQIESMLTVEKSSANFLENEVKISNENKNSNYCQNIFGNGEQCPEGKILSPKVPNSVSKVDSSSLEKPMVLKSTLTSTNFSISPNSKAAFHLNSISKTNQTSRCVAAVKPNLNNCMTESSCRQDIPTSPSLSCNDLSVNDILKHINNNSSKEMINCNDLTALQSQKSQEHIAEVEEVIKNTMPLEKDSLSSHAPKVVNDVVEVSKAHEIQNKLSYASAEGIDSLTIPHDSVLSKSLQIISSTKELDTNTISTPIIMTSEPSSIVTHTSKIDSYTVEHTLTTIANGQFISNKCQEKSTDGSGKSKHISILNTSESNKTSEIKSSLNVSAVNTSAPNNLIKNTNSENMMKIIKESVPELSRNSDNFLESASNILQNYDCSVDTDLSTKLSSDLSKVSTSLSAVTSNKNVLSSVQECLTGQNALIQTINDAPPLSVVDASIKTNSLVKASVSNSLIKSAPNSTISKPRSTNKNYSSNMNSTGSISCKMSQKTNLEVEDFNPRNAENTPVSSTTALNPVKPAPMTSKPATTLIPVTGMSSMINENLTPSTISSNFGNSVQSSPSTYINSITNSSMINSNCCHLSKNQSEFQTSNLALSESTLQTSKPKCSPHVVNSAKEVQVTCSSGSSYHPSHWLSLVTTASSLSDSTNSQKNTNAKTYTENTQCVQTSSYSQPSHSGNYQNAETLSKSGNSMSNSSNFENSLAVPFSQNNNCGGDGLCFGNSFQNSSLPFFNNFMHFANATLPYSSISSNYTNYSTYNNSHNYFNKLKPQSYNDCNKLSTPPSVTQVEPSQNSLLPSSVTSLPDTTKLIQNLLGPTSVTTNSGNDQKSNIKSSVEELDKLLLQTISSTVGETRMTDLFSSGTLASNESKLEKSNNDNASNNELSTTPKQNIPSNISPKQNLLSNYVSPKQNSQLNASAVKLPVISDSNSKNSTSQQSIGDLSTKIKIDLSKSKVSSQSNENTKSSHISNNENVSFENILNDTPNNQIISKINNTPNYSSESFSPTESSYKLVCQQSEFGKQLDSSNQRNSTPIKSNIGENLQQNKSNNQVISIPNSSNLKKNISMEKSLPPNTSSSSYTSYPQINYFNTPTTSTSNIAESSIGKKMQRPSGCSGSVNVQQSSLGINTAMNNYQESTSSNLTTTQRPNSSQATSWDNSSPLNPFFFNSNGEAYGVPNPYKSGFAMNTNSCFQQNIFRSNNNNNNSLNAKDTNMNSHAQTNFNSTTNASCSPKITGSMNAHYGLESNAKKGVSNSETYDNFSPGSQKYNSSHASLYYSNYNNNFANFFSNSQGQASPSLSSLVSGSGYNFPLTGSKFSSGQQYLNFSQNTPNNSYFPSSNFNMNCGSPNYQNCINHCPSPNTGGSNMSSNLGNNFSGPLCNISLPYYSNCSFSYNSYPYLYQGGDMGLLSPTASFMPPFSCLPSRPSLGSRNTSSSQSFNDFSLQSGFFPMMPFVSPLQGNGARATPPPVGGSIPHSFGSRPFQSNYPNKPMTYESSGKMSQKSHQLLPKTSTGTTGASSSKNKHRKASSSSKSKVSSGKETDTKGAKGPPPIPPIMPNECSTGVSLEISLNSNQLQSTGMEDSRNSSNNTNSSNNNNYSNTNYNNNYNNNNNHNGLIGRVNTNPTLEKQKKREFPSL